MAQMLCQAKLDELLIDPSQLRAVQEEPIAGFPQWNVSIDWAPTEIEGLVRVKVRVRPAPDREPALLDPRGVLVRPAFELVRRMRYRHDAQAAAGTQERG